MIVNLTVYWNLTYLFNIAVLDLKVENGMLSRGPAKDGVVPTVFITVDDDVFADWILYKISAENVSYIIFYYSTIFLIHSNTF